MDYYEQKEKRAKALNRRKADKRHDMFATRKENRKGGMIAAL